MDYRANEKFQDLESKKENQREYIKKSLGMRR